MIPQEMKTRVPDQLTGRLQDLEQQFPALHLTRSSRFAKRLGRLLLVLMVLCLLAAFFVPWQQSIRGEGAVTAFDPNERPQDVLAQVKGIVAQRGEKVVENAYVEKGELLFEIVDQDPTYLFRLEEQVRYARTELSTAEERLRTASQQPELYEDLVASYRDGLRAERAAQSDLGEMYAQAIVEKQEQLEGKRAKVRDAEAKLKLAVLDLERYRNLTKGQETGLVPLQKFQEAEQKHAGAVAALQAAERDVLATLAGIESKKSERDSKLKDWDSKIAKTSGALREAETKLGDARIKIDKTKGEVAEKKSKLQKAERAFEAQKTQTIHAPRSGYITMEMAVVEGMPVKAGQKLCQIVPKTENPAVEVWVSGNDAPLIHQGDHVRLQFEGWPAVQFSGWPSVAVGTFGGQVASVNATDDGKGKFRVIVVPDPTDHEWPEHPYLRPGVRTNGWVLLDRVPLGYEVWRRMNGFPPSLQDIEADTAKKGSKPPKIKI